MADMATDTPKTEQERERRERLDESIQHETDEDEVLGLMRCAIALERCAIALERSPGGAP